MESAIEIIKDAIKTGNMTEHHGTCEKHGDSTITLPTKFSRGWSCKECHFEKLKEEEREKWLQDRNETLHRIAEIPRKYKAQKFVATTPAQKAARTMAKAYRDYIVENNEWAVLVMMGGVGTGKTLMASEFAESLINNNSMSVRYCTAKQMINEIQIAYNPAEGKTEEGEILRFVQYDVLILDEIDAKPDRENANILLTEVINRRYNSGRPVIIITNQPFDNLDKFVGSRVDDRLHENSFVCNFDWPSFRRAGYEPVKAPKSKGFQ